LPGKTPKQPVMIESRILEGVGWSEDVLRFHFSTVSVTNPGETVFEHLPPGQYVVVRYQETPMGKNGTLASDCDRQPAKIASNQRATIRFERKVGRPLEGRVRGLENIKLRYAYVHIMYPAPEKQLGADGRRGRILTGFDRIPIQADSRFTTGSYISLTSWHLFSLFLPLFLLRIFGIDLVNARSTDRLHPNHAEGGS